MFFIAKRAISDEQKEQRRDDIVNAAKTLFDERTFESIKITDIARKAEVAKGTIFIYFKTKEQLFLELAMKEFESWFNEMNAFLKEYTNGLQRDNPIDELTDFIRYSIKNRLTLLRLISILHTVLEKNIDLENAIRFKKFLYENILNTGDLLERHMIFLKPGQGPELILSMYTFIVGSQNISELSPTIKEAIEINGFEIFNVNFEESFIKTLKTYIKGMCY